jgi:tetratricopeptide (TPR) repeat protein
LRAEAAADQAVALAPDAPEGYRARGWIRHLLSWDWAGAQAPLAPFAWQALTLAYLASRDFPAARAANQRALEISPDSTWALNDLGELQLLGGEAAKALLTFLKLETRVFCLAGTAEAEHTLGHAKESQEALEELTAKAAAVVLSRSVSASLYSSAVWPGIYSLGDEPTPLSAVTSASAAASMALKRGLSRRRVKSGSTLM